MSCASKPLVVELPAELGTEIEQLARQRQQSPTEIVAEACREHLAVLHTAPDDEQYARGYTDVPEDTADLEALLPHLPLPQEKW